MGATVGTAVAVGSGAAVGGADVAATAGGGDVAAGATDVAAGGGDVAAGATDVAAGSAVATGAGSTESEPQADRVNAPIATARPRMIGLNLLLINPNGPPFNRKISVSVRRSEFRSIIICTEASIKYNPV